MPRSKETYKSADNLRSPRLPPPVSYTVVQRSPAELRSNPRHARTHSDENIRRFSEAILKFGFISPVQVDSAGTILAGHARVQAAKLLGMPTIPTVQLDHLSEAERRAYVIWDNRAAELGGWDKSLLALELKDLELSDFDLDLDLTGFSLDERSLVIDVDGGTVAEDACPTPSVEAPVSRLGDVWLLGGHRVICGSALETGTYKALMGAERGAMVFADLPYNVPIQGHVSGLGRNRHAEFAMASGEMSEVEFTTFLRSAFELMTAYAEQGSIHFLCIDWRHIGELLAAAKGIFTELKNMAVWAKPNGGMGALYRSRHELVFVYKHGTTPHLNMVQLGRHGRNRTNIWEYAGQTSFHRDRDTELAAHPTVKPVALVADAIKDVSRRGDLVLDPFGGSGTTLIAAEKTGRKARLIEIEPTYVDVTIRRWQALTGGTATLEDTGESFDTLKAAGRAPSAAIFPFPSLESPAAKSVAKQRGRRARASTSQGKEKTDDAA